MAQKRSNRISTFGSQLTSIVSVSLVLIILGVLALVGIAGQSGIDMLKSNLGFIVKIERTASDSEVNRLKKYFAGAPFVASYVFSSAEEILAAESEYLGDDIVALVDVNPYGAEFDVKVKGDYASVDSIEALSAMIVADAAVEDVLTETSMIAAVNSTLSRIAWILLAVALALLLISVILINNTVHLAIYSRRFVIYTMKLVGATGSFIRRPFVIAGAINGLIAAAVASLIIISGCAYGATVDPILASAFSPKLCLIVVAALFIAGMIICTVASLFATNRYLRANYDDMFMK